MRKKPNVVPNERDFIIAYHIKELREANYPGRGGGAKCAEAMDVSTPQYYHWENATRTPRLKNLDKVAQFFGKPLEHFYEKPEGWEFLYPKMLRLWKQRVGIPADMEIEEVLEAKPEPATDKLPTTGQALRSMDQMNSIIKHLLKKQLMAEEGQIDVVKFEKALDELYEYTVFKLPN